MKMRGRFWLGILALAIPVMSGCTQEVEQLRKENSEQKMAIMEYEKRNQELVSEIAALNARFGGIEAELDGKDRMISAMRQTIERLRKAGVLEDKVQRQLEILAEEFGGELIGNRLQLPGDYLFPPGRYGLTQQSQVLLQKLSSILKDEDLVLLIVGHTDSDPVNKAKRLGIKDNRHLSMMRAYSVLEELDKSGYPKNRMYATGWGELFPVASNSTKEGKRLNRRVEILIDPAASGLFPISAIYDVEGQGGPVVHEK